MEQRSRDEETQAALATTAQILASLRGERDPDQALHKIIEAVEEKQAELLASLIDTNAKASRAQR
jgi:hypothetical protein